MLAALTFPLLLLVLVLLLAWVEDRLVPPEEIGPSPLRARDEARREAPSRPENEGELQPLEPRHAHEPVQAAADGNGRRQPRRSGGFVVRPLLTSLRTERGGAHRAHDRGVARITRPRLPR